MVFNFLIDQIIKGRLLRPSILVKQPLYFDLRNMVLKVGVDDVEKLRGAWTSSKINVDMRPK
jgi:hypothetical protein